ncbi:unnamed protein product [Trichogramma brassicae]|uniref:Uncharacterized protein n=1 Tax=Trichogramma brassicae TaxID=86971 RepID=A0A6H5IX93_9HYME|nr:unnamed protein product [Trichogramma brassicae]
MDTAIYASPTVRSCISVLNTPQKAPMARAYDEPGPALMLVKKQYQLLSKTIWRAMTYLQPMKLIVRWYRSLTFLPLKKQFQLLSKTIWCHYFDTHEYIVTHLMTLRPRDILQVIEFENVVNYALPRNEESDPEFDYDIVREFRQYEVQLPLAMNPILDRGHEPQKLRLRRRPRARPYIGQQLLADAYPIAPIEPVPLRELAALALNDDNLQRPLIAGELLARVIVQL